MRIRVDEWYGNERVYPYMSEEVFKRLEDAYLNKREVVEVSESEYNEMEQRWAAIVGM